MANWFAYNGVGDLYLPGSYTRMFVKPTCITGGPDICAIYLNDNSTTTPSSIDLDVQWYIVDALGTFVSQPQCDKRFVYLKLC